MVVRLAFDEDLVALQEIERASAQRYRDYGLDQVADDQPASLEVLSSYARAGRAWVAVNDAGLVIGYILVDVIDGSPTSSKSVSPPTIRAKALVEHLSTRCESGRPARGSQLSRSQPSSTSPGTGLSTNILALGPSPMTSSARGCRPCAKPEPTTASTPLRESPCASTYVPGTVWRRKPKVHAHINRTKYPK